MRVPDLYLDLRGKPTKNNSDSCSRTSKNPSWSDHQRHLLKNRPPHSYSHRLSLSAQYQTKPANKFAFYTISCIWSRGLPQLRLWVSSSKNHYFLRRDSLLSLKRTTLSTWTSRVSLSQNQTHPPKNQFLKSTARNKRGLKPKAKRAHPGSQKLKSSDRQPKPNSASNISAAII